MPIRIPDELPAAEVLRSENIFVMPQTRAIAQEIRPLKVILLNLMPKKIETENQILRLLSNTPLQIDVHLLRIDHRVSKNTPKAHIDRFYRDFDKIRQSNFDGLIITGAPLGLTPFADVYYWDQICEIIRWSTTHVTSSLFLCWAAQVALNVLYGMPRHTLDKKLSGVYEHQSVGGHNKLLRGFDDTFLAPLSRNAAFPIDVIKQYTDLDVLAKLPESNELYLAASHDLRQVFVTGHPEYDADTLANEYHRDESAGLSPTLPHNYFPNNDASHEPLATWRSHGSLLYSNWINYCVYQITPYDLKKMHPSEND